jgi:hypothetical protein
MQESKKISRLNRLIFFDSCIHLFKWFYGSLLQSGYENQNADEHERRNEDCFTHGDDLIRRPAADLKRSQLFARRFANRCGCIAAGLSSFFNRSTKS